MKRTIAMLGAALVLLLLASGFMAADNIRLSGEKAALTDKFNDQGYEYSLVYHQLQSAKQQIDELTRERDELKLELQDYQPGTETGRTVLSADDMERTVDEDVSGDAAEAQEVLPGEAVTPDELAKAISSDEAAAAAAADKTGSADIAPAEENIFAIEDETVDAEKDAADLALPFVPAVENAMADAAPDTAMQLEQLRLEVQALSRQVDMLRAQLTASRLNETGMGKVLSSPSPVPPARTPEPPQPLDTLFHQFTRIPHGLQWAEEPQGE